MTKKVNKNRIILSLAFAIIIVIAMLFMFYKLSTIPADAEQCLKNPLTYAEDRLEEETDMPMTCECGIKRTQQFNGNFGDIEW